MPTILCYGSINPDLVFWVDHLPGSGEDLQAEQAGQFPGGGGANVAVDLAAWGAHPVLVGNEVAPDPSGTALLADLARRGVDVTFVARTGPYTPRIVVLVTPDRERTIISSGYAGLSWSPIPERVLPEAAAVLVDRYSDSAGVAAAGEAAARDIPVVGLDAGRELAQLADWVVWSRAEHPNDADAQALAGEGRIVVVTDGPRPTVAWTPTERLIISPPLIRPVDPTGAGDTVAAMCAFGLDAGWPAEQAVRMAVAAGSLAAARGRGEPTPTIEEIRESADLLG